MDNRLTKAERDQIRANIDMMALAANPLTCRALLSLLEECDWLKDGINSLHLKISDFQAKQESLRKIVNTAKIQLAAGDRFDADLTLELALRELQ